MTQEEVPLPSKRFETCCRLCLSGDELSCSLFPVVTHPDGTTDGDHRTLRTEHRLIEMILECTSIQITLEEDYPAKVCKKCVETVDTFYQYRRRCLANDQILRLERQRAGGQRKNNNNNNNEEDEGNTSSSPLLPSVHRSPGNGESRQHQQQTQRSSPAAGGTSVTMVPAIRIKSEPLPPLDQRRVSGEEVKQDGEQYVPSAVEHDAASTADGGMSSILRSILLQTRDSTTSRSSPNTEPESPRQTPQLLPIHPPPSFPCTDTVPEERPEDEDEEKDVKPSLLQQMLLQQQCCTSPANRSPAKLSDSNSTTAVGGQDGSLSASTTSNTSTATTTTSTTSSLLKRMLLDGSGTTVAASAAQEQTTAQPPGSVSPLEGTSCQQQRHRTKHEPPSATNTPSPPSSVHRPKEDVPLPNETPLASQLRSILLQHRATSCWARTTSLSDGSPELPTHQPHGSDTDQKPNTVPNTEKPEVSYVRSLFLRNDSDSESEPPPVEDQREMLLYAMFHELRARQQQQQQQQQSQSGFSTDSDDDSDDLPQDYRMPSVRRRSTDSVESRSKRRRMEYPCLLCGRTFAGRTKLVLHMRTHMMLDGATDGSSPLSGTAGSGFNAVASGGTPTHTLVPGVSLPNGAGDVEDIATGRLVIAQQHHTRNDEAFGGSIVGNEDEIDALERRSYACYICGADQNNLHQLKEHLLAAHQDRIRSRGRTRERQKASIACEICQRQFRSQFAYGEHMRTHTGERPFPCDQCDKRFPRRFQLLGHLYNVHKQSWVADESKAKFAKK